MKSDYTKDYDARDAYQVDAYDNWDSSFIRRIRHKNDQRCRCMPVIYNSFHFFLRALNSIHNKGRGTINILNFVI